MDGGGGRRPKRGGGLSPPRSGMEFDWFLLAVTRWRVWWAVPFGRYTCDLVALRGGCSSGDTWYCGCSFGRAATVVLSISS